MSQRELIAFYAPDIVQMQQINQIRYNPAIDQFGKLKMIRDHSNNRRVFVDVGDPVVYTHTRDIQFGQKLFLQITYEFWYPEHPEMLKGDKEAGKLDGRFLTITLDDERLPVIYETAMNCGCFYEVYATDRIGGKAFQEISSIALPSKYKGKPIAGILKPGIDKKTGIMMNAGFHTVAELFCAENGKRLPGSIVRCLETRQYQLETVETLELLPFEGGYASIYHNNGLIMDGGRPESYLLWLSYPENYYAGWNRHQSQRRYGLNPDKEGFHNPFWIQSVFFADESPGLLSNVVTNERIKF